MEEGDVLKKISGILAVISFFYVLGTVGGMEHDTIALGAGIIRVGLGLGGFGLFCKLSGAFRHVSPRNGKSR